MMRSRSARSFDVHLAGKLSRRLSGTEEPKAETVTRAAPRYVQFRAAVPPSMAAAPPPYVEEETDPALPALPLEEIDTWEKLLAWGLELTGASAAFVVDSQGFVIASRGKVPSDGFVAAGAELCYAVEQLDRVEPEAGGLRSVDIEFAGRRMAAMRVATAEGQAVIASFVVSRSISDEVKAIILKQAEFTLPMVV